MKIETDPPRIRMPETLAAHYQRPYEFSHDMFSYHIENWRQWLAGHIGKPYQRFLEIGTFEGASAIWLLENVLTDPTAHLTVLDCFTDRNRHDEAVEDVLYRNLEVSGQRERVTVIKGLSEERLFSFSPKSFDFIYVDAGHRGRDALTDGVMGWHLLKDGGVMIFDDYRAHEFYPAELATDQGIDSFVTMFRSEVKELVRTRSQLLLCKRQRDFTTTDTYLAVQVGRQTYDWRSKSLNAPNVFYRSLTAHEVSVIEGAIRGIPDGTIKVDTERLGYDLMTKAQTTWEDIEKMDF